MRVVFMGTPDFSVAALEALADAGHDVVCAYTQPPRPAGRGKAPRPSAVATAADRLGIEVRHPLNFKDKADVDAFAGLGADVAVVVAYGLILPQALLDAPRLGCLNIHASLLPRWRGAAPIQRAIMAGDAETGVCIMQMEAGLDTGPVLDEASLVIGASETAGELHDRLAALGAGRVVDVLRRAGAWQAKEQPEEGVTYARKIDKAEARVDWAQPAEQVDRLIRGLSPFPGAWSEMGGVRLKFLTCEVTPGSGAPGEVLDQDFVVACGTGAVRITRAQRPGRGAMASRDFLRGFAVEPGAIFD